MLAVVMTVMMVAMLAVIVVLMIGLHRTNERMARVLDGSSWQRSAPPLPSVGAERDRTVPMVREEVIERFCRLACTVNEQRFQFCVASDCICEPSTSGMPFRYDPDVLEFIERAVREKLTESERS